MKKILLPVLMLLALVSCTKFDDSSIWEELKDHESRIIKLETLCNQLNTNITSLQTVVTALQENDYVKNIAPIMENGKEIGYTITFAKNGSITIYHGKDGNDGEDGKDGENGKDGINGIDGSNGKDGLTPVIGVRKYTDGVYYWTLNGEWLLDDAGNKIPTTGKNGTDGSDGKDGVDGEDGRDGANGTDGKDGQDGEDGITPQLKIEDDYWYISYDNGTSWQKLGKATGNNGLNGTDGEDGDSIIKSITQDAENVYFNLSDGTLLTLPKRNTDIIVFEDLAVKAICCKNWDTNLDGELSYSEAAAVTYIGSVFKGNTNIIAFTELRYFTGLSQIPQSAFENCTNLWKITLPDGITSIDSYAFRKCSGLASITLPDSVISIGSSAFEAVTSLSRIKFGKGLQKIQRNAFYNCPIESVEFSESLQIIGENAFYGHKLVELVIPKNVYEIGAFAFDQYPYILRSIYCLPETPPSTTNYMFSYPDNVIFVIYVPESALDAYKNANHWDEYKNRIFAINE